MALRVITSLGESTLLRSKGGVNEDLKLLAVSHALSLGDPRSVILTLPRLVSS